MVRDVFPYQKSEAGDLVEKIRREMAGRKDEIIFTDLGAGSLNQGGGQVKTNLGRLARRSARHRRSGEMLFRLCRHFQPRRILEFGTNLGISALYQSFGAENADILSLEGAAPLAGIARQNLLQAGRDVEVVHTDFDSWLASSALAELKPDYVFLDGNHQYQPTIDYVNRFLEHMPPESLLILDDIHWSAGMSKAWEEICKDERITVSIDLFYLGLCFVKRKQAKEHFFIRM